MGRCVLRSGDEHAVHLPAPDAWPADRVAAVTARSLHDELRARAEDVQRQFDSGGPLQAPPAHLVAAWPYEVLALLDEVAAADARAEKLEQALRELKALTLDPTHAARMITRRQIRLIIDPALAAAAGDSWEPGE